MISSTALFEVLEQNTHRWFSRVVDSIKEPTAQLRAAGMWDMLRTAVQQYCITLVDEVGSISNLKIIPMTLPAMSPSISCGLVAPIVVVASSRNTRVRGSDHTGYWTLDNADPIYAGTMVAKDVVLEIRRDIRMFTQSDLVLIYAPQTPIMPVLHHPFKGATGHFRFMTRYAKATITIDNISTRVNR